MHLVIDSGGTSFKYLISSNDCLSKNRFSKGEGNVITNYKKVYSYIEDILINNDIDTAIAGLAGYYSLSDNDKKNLENLFRKYTKKFMIISDALLPTYGFNYNSILSIISGTGSAIFRRTTNNVEKYLGYGFIIGDIGSGFDIGRNILHYALSENESILLNEIKKILNINGDIISYIYKDISTANKKIASITKLINSENHNVARIAKKFAIQSQNKLLKYTKKIVKKNDVIILNGSIFNHFKYFYNELSKIINNKIIMNNDDPLSLGLKSILEETW